MGSASRRRRRGFSILGLAVVLGLLTLLAGFLVRGTIGSRTDGRAARILDLYQSALRATEGSPAQGPGHATGDSLPGAQATGGLAILVDQNDAAVHVAEPFDLRGDGNLTNGPARLLVVTGVDEGVARGVDGSIDRGVPGPWHRSGRVQFTGTSLAVFIAALPASAAPAGR